MKKKAISHVVAFILGALGSWFGKDLSGLQEPMEKAATVAVDKTEAAVKKKIEEKAPAAKDAGPVLDAPAQ